MNNQSFRNFIKQVSSYDQGEKIFYSYAVLIMMYPLIELNCNDRTKAITLMLSNKIQKSNELEDCLKNLGVPEGKVQLLCKFVKNKYIGLIDFAHLETELYWEYIFKCPDLRYKVCDRENFQRACELGCILSQVFSDISILDKLVEQVGA